MPEPKDPNKTPDPVFLGYYPDGEPVQDIPKIERDEWREEYRRLRPDDEQDDDTV